MKKLFYLTLLMGFMVGCSGDVELDTAEEDPAVEQDMSDDEAMEEAYNQSMKEAKQQQ